MFVPVVVGLRSAQNIRAMLAALARQVEADTSIPLGE
jgi:hypothetical protein